MGMPLARSPVSRLSRERRVADIVAAARRVFEQKGYDEALIADIAAQADVVEGTIYRYFENKRALFASVIEHWYGEMLLDHDEKLQEITGTWSRLRFMIWRHLCAIHDQPALSRLVFQVLRTGADYRRTAVFDLNRAYTQTVVAIVKEGQARGELNGDIQLRLVRDIIYGCIEHRTWAYLRGEGDFSPEQTADSIAEFVYRGLAKPAADACGGAASRDLVDRLTHIAGQLEGNVGAIAQNTGRAPQQ
jgi:AcrR family transcriptional regulator